MTATGMAIWGILRHVIVIQETKNRVKQPFLGPKFIKLLIIQKPLDVESLNLNKTWL